MSRLIIHIGLPKTGTTFLQHSLFSARAELEAQGVLYPDPIAGLGPVERKSVGHHWLAHALLGRRKRFTADADFALLNDHVAGLRQAIAESPVETAIISSEEMSAFREPMIRELRSLLPDMNIQILVYLRRQDLWLNSYFAQMAKVRKEATPKEIFKSEKWRLDYEKFLEDWSTHFGSENVLVRPYGTGEGYDDLWTDFLTAIGVADPARVPADTTNTNRSLPYELTMFTQALNRFGEQRRLRRLLEELSAFFASPDGLVYFSEAFARKILDKFEKSNSAVAEKYLSRPVLFKNMTIVSSGKAGESLGADDYAAILGGICLRLARRVDKLERQVASLKSRVRGVQLLSEEDEEDEEESEPVRIAPNSGVGD